MRQEYLKSIGPMFPGFEMFEPAERGTFTPLMSLPVASPVRISPSLDQEPAWTENEAAYGVSSTASFAHYDLDTSSWKTWQLCVTGGYGEYSEIWPEAGMMRNGECFKLLISDTPTNASACLLLPTPTRTDAFASIRTTRKGALDCLLYNKHQKRWFYYGIWLHNLNSGGAHPQFAELMMGFPAGWSDWRA